MLWTPTWPRRRPCVCYRRAKMAFGAD
jgi:hypothetical protein